MRAGPTAETAQLSGPPPRRMEACSLARVGKAARAGSQVSEPARMEKPRSAAGNCGTAQLSGPPPRRMEARCGGASVRPATPAHGSLARVGKTARAGSQVSEPARIREKPRSAAGNCGTAQVSGPPPRRMEARRLARVGKTARAGSQVSEPARMREKPRSAAGNCGTAQLSGLPPRRMEACSLALVGKTARAGSQVSEPARIREKPRSARATAERRNCPARRPGAWKPGAWRGGQNGKGRVSSVGTCQVREKPRSTASNCGTAQLSGPPPRRMEACSLARVGKTARAGSQVSEPARIREKPRSTASSF